MVNFSEDGNTVLGCVSGDENLDILRKYHVVKNSVFRRICFHIMKSIEMK